jgi:1,4-dihydroxy-2-naphthoate octaprenyltransferase
MDAGTFARLVRVQFTPVMVAPVVLGAAFAWHTEGAFNPVLFALALLGAILLHLAANAIDDVYDYVNGVDRVAEEMFPKDAPGWKPLARGRVSLGGAFLLSYTLYGLSVLIGVYLSFTVGWPALGIALPGILLSYFYTAPPLRLDYRGAGLGEASILLSFGPIPALGTYYVLTGHVAPLAALVSIPSGLLTTAILLSHDMIFYDVYRTAGKRSLTVVIGRPDSARLVTVLGAAAYLILASFIVSGIVPERSAVAFLAFPLLLKVSEVRRRERTPAEYGKRTMLVFIHSVTFTLLFSVGLLLG